ncbi:hypothetical protein MGG_17047 [Pyricularia oryzae 70-15]|uniref:Uncharacterized protein n=1 Tax=Pyricularia oryzae (strain 70-15 / ATCC MYA-4617 / FGSC 8958) TaxID=242507 RepID=G4N677_PYRO7|nr:uncharacterized protein MGG_17047 [Pyricularia oryzae 70-15]EHA49801.1 hypothetical protein MGG_17047 [Pyricularia oryzae 70-15]
MGEKPSDFQFYCGTAAEQPGRTTDGSGNQRTTNPSSQVGEALIASQLFYRGTELM